MTDSIPSFRYMCDTSLFLDALKHFHISHAIGPTDLLYPSPAPHLKTLNVLLIYFPKCHRFSTNKAMAQT